MTYVWRRYEPALPARPDRKSRPGDAVAWAPAAAGNGIGIVTDRAGFDALEGDWNALFARAGRGTQLFQTFNWNWHWANHYLDAGASHRPTPSLAIVTGHRDGRLVMVWPLVIAHAAGLQIVQWMGDPVSQYGDALIDDIPDRASLLRQAWQVVTAGLGADVLYLRKVRADAAIAPLLREAGLAQVAAEEAPYLDLASAPDFAAYEQRYSGKARKNRRRLMRRLGDKGTVAVDRHTGGACARAAAAAAIALKQSWIKETGRISRALADERFARFFADVADGGCRPAGCGVTVLRSGAATAGVAIDITCAGRRGAHLIVNDAGFNDVGAGSLLLEQWIRGACADGIAVFDLLAPAFAYKREWADGTVAVGDFARGLTWRGRIYAAVYLQAVRAGLKAASEAWPHFRARILAAWPRRSAGQEG